MRLRFPTVALVAALALGMVVGRPALAYLPVSADDFTRSGILKGDTSFFEIRAMDGDSYVVPLTFELGAPGHGTATIVEGGYCPGGYERTCSAAIRYIPDHGFVGTDTFEFIATDDEAMSDTGLITLTYIDDTTAPTGSLFVYGNNDASGGWTNTTDLLVRVQADDDLTYVNRVRLSNTGTMVDGMLTAFEEFEWLLGLPDLMPWTMQNATGGTTSAGAHVVYAQWADRLGNWSTVRSATIHLDKTKPVVTGVTVKLAGKTSAHGILARIAFSVSDSGCGAGRHEMERRVDGKAWTPLNVYLVSRSVDLEHTGGHTYRYRVRTGDCAGNDMASWTYGPTFETKRFKETHKAVRYTGRWGRIHYIDFPIKTAYSTSRGSTARLTFTGKAVAWESIMGPKRGKAAIYIDGRHVKTVDLKATSNTRAVSYRKHWATSGRHTITIRVIGTSGRPKVEFDGFAIIR